jgi:zinc protease
MRIPSWTRIAVALPLLLAATVALAFNSKVKGKPVPYQGYALQGPTGIRIVSYEIPVSPRATVGVSYRAGSSDDPPGKEGMAHLAEHLAFRGRPGGGLRLWDRLEAAGVEFNAFTTTDHTTYYAVGRTDQLVAMAEAEAARLRDPLAGIGPEEFETERDVVLSELRQRQDHSPTTVQIEWLLALGMGGHAYGRSIIGTEASLRSITLEDVRTWMKRHYTPAAAIAVLCSPLPAKDAAQAFAARFDDQFFGTNPAAEKLRAVPRAPPPLPALPVDLPLLRRTGPVERPTLWLGWILPGQYAVQSARAVASTSYVSALVSQALRSFKDGSGERYVDGVSAGLWEMDGAALVYARVELRDEADAQWALDKVKGSLFKVGDSYGLMGQFARDEMLVEHYTALEETAAVGAIAQHLRVHGDPDYLGGWQKQIAAHLTEGIHDFVREHFVGERTFGMLVVPDKNPRLPASSTARGDLPPPSLDDAWKPPARGIVDVARAPGFDRVQRRRLENGLEVVVARRGAAPVAEVRLAFRTELDGTAAFPAGTAALAMASLTSPNLLSIEKVQYGIQTWQTRGPGRLVRTERGSAGNLDKILEFAGRWARNSSLDDRLSRMKSEYVRSLTYDRKRPSARAQEEFLATLFPGNPLGTSLTEGSVATVTSSQVEAWADASLRPERATLVVVSSLEPDEELWSAIESEFGGWKGSGKARARETTDPSLPVARTIVLVDQPGATQPLLQVGLASPPRSARDDAARETLATYLAWTLQRQLRMESGVTYGVSARWLDRGAADPLALSLAVSDGALVPALRTILDTVASSAAKPSPSLEIQRARWQVARGLTLGFDTVRSSASELADMSLRGRPPDYWERFPASLAAVDPGRVQAAAKALAVGQEAIVIVGDASRLRPMLEAAGFKVDRVVASGSPTPEGGKAGG